MLTTICIEGTKGAGKSTTIQNLKTALEDMRFKVRVKAPFYDVRSELKRQTGFDNTYPASLDTYAAPIGNELLFQQIENDIYSQKKDEILIFDRGWLTGLTTLLTSVLSFQEKRKEFKRWKKLMIPTIFIHTKPDNTLLVRQNELSFNVGLKDKKMVESDYVLRYKLIQKYKKCVVAECETFPLAENKEEQQIELKNKLIETILEV